ncbi:sugar phosphate isomerase/epimerase family protein [Chitinimonas lacunae]|uniref:Sugar phosphate isomerase/epimerase family protein n=1 Tax=Chitinimonas lacunae TaxID=1963018 RepID=A0ABV8MIG4_9NEIS
MRLSISNIAWEREEDPQIAELLAEFSVDAIDVAPGKYFPAPTRASADEIARVRQWWEARGVEIVGMQALLFGTSGLNLFGPTEVQQAMLDHLSAVCRIGAGLGANRLVFGSPKNRDRSGLDDGTVLDIALPFLRRLGDIAGQHGVLVCLEPNPRHYGANFMVDSAETAKVVQAVAHPAIQMQLDTGALALNGETAAEVLPAYAGLIGHIHASEPDLLPLGDGNAEHMAVAALLRRHLPNHPVAIEMLATRQESHLASIRRALRVADRAYRQELAA